MEHFDVIIVVILAGLVGIVGVNRLGALTIVFYKEVLHVVAPKVTSAWWRYVMRKQNAFDRTKKHLAKNFKRQNFEEWFGEVACVVFGFIGQL